MDGLIREMNSPRGRILRIVLGAEMLAIGIYFGGVLGWSIALAGLVPMVPAFWLKPTLVSDAARENSFSAARRAAHGET